MSGVIVRAIKVVKAIVILPIFVLLCSCNALDDGESRTSRYNSETLAKDWRSNVNDRLNQRNKRTPYPYPADNDSEYVYPTRGYTSPRTAPTPAYPADNDSEYVYPIQRYTPAPRRVPSQPVYPVDNDSNYYDSYPTYDSDADNSGYYYMNKNKRLPKRRAPEATTNDENYNYPIYFD